MLPWYLAPDETPRNTRGGAGIRFGNVVFRDRDFNTWLSPYVVAGAGFKPNITETLAFINVALLGENAQANVSTIVGNLFDSDEGNGLADVDLDTTGTMLPTEVQAVDKLRFALVATAREVPPLGQLPMRARDPDTFGDSGTPEQVAYVWCQEPQISVTAGPIGLQVHGPDGDDTNYSTVRGDSIPGWTKTQFNEQVNNSEPDGDQTDAFRIFYDGAELAKARPWRGWMLIHGLPDTAAGPPSYDVSSAFEHYRAFVSGGTAWMSTRWNQAGTWTDFDTGLAAEYVSIRAERSTPTRRIFLTVVDTGDLIEYISTDQGNTFDMGTTLHTGDPSGVSGFAARDNTRYTYWLEDTGSGIKVYVLIRDQAGNILHGPTEATGIGDADDAGVAAYWTIESARLRVYVQVTQSGALVEYGSDDGRAFS